MEILLDSFLTWVPHVGDYQFTSLLLCHLRKRSSYPLNTMLDGPQNLSGRFGKEKYVRTALFCVITQRVVVINYHY